MIRAIEKRAFILDRKWRIFMKVAIMTDLEGISGVDRFEQMEPEGGYRYACERLMADTNAAVDGAISAGAETVYVVDGHGTGRNFIDELLDPRAKHVSIPDWQELTRAGEIGAYLQVGAHAMPGTINGFLDHVQSSVKWYNYYINNIRCGEIVQGALFSGAWGAPTVMVSGDEAACAEARAMLGCQVACAAVKRGVGRNRAECVEISRAEELIRAAAADGVRRAGEMKPFTLPMPLHLKVEFTRSDYCEDSLKNQPTAWRVDARCLEKTLEKIHSYSDLLFW